MIDRTELIEDTESIQSEVITKSNKRKSNKRKEKEYKEVCEVSQQIFST